MAEEARADGFGPLRTLVQTVAVYAARIARIDTLCVTVNPRHVRFYERRLGFERFGPPRAYDAVNGAPAVPLALDLQRALTTPRDDVFALDGRDAARLAARLRAELARLQILHRDRRDRAIGGSIAAEVC
jgi:hypothetical protein